MQAKLVSDVLFVQSRGRRGAQEKSGGTHALRAHASILRCAVFSVAIAGLACSFLFAQETPQGLTLQDCFDLALARNPQLRATEAELAVSRATLAGQRGRWEPSLIASWAWRTQQPLARPIQVGGGVVRSTGDRSTSRDLSLTVNQTIYEPGLHESIRAAGEQVTASSFALVDARRRLLLEVATTFHTVLADQELAEVAQSAVEASQRHLELVDARIEAGTAAAADRLPIEAELADAKFEAVRTANAIWQVIADLKTLLGVGAGSPLKLDGEPTVAPNPGQLTDWLEGALAQRPDVQAQNARVRAAQHSLRQARIGAGLDVSLIGQADYGRHSGTSGESWWLGAGASYPLYDRTSKAQVDAAEARLRATQERLAELKLNVSREIAKAWYAATDADERLRAVDAAVRTAEANLEAARERYAQGVANIIEVTDAELSWRRAQANRVQARYDRNVAYYQLLAAAGRPLAQE